MCNRMCAATVPLYMPYVRGALSRLSGPVGRAVMRAAGDRKYAGNEVFDDWVVLST